MSMVVFCLKYCFSSVVSYIMLVCWNDLDVSPLRMVFGKSVDSLAKLFGLEVSLWGGVKLYSTSLVDVGLLGLSVSS